MKLIQISAALAGSGGDIPLSDKLTVGVQTLVLGLGTVFAVLCILWFMIAMIGKIVGKVESSREAKKPAPAAPAAPAPEPEPEVEDGIGEEELVAVITAAIAAYGGDSASRLKIRSVRRAR